jgi:hypothetical protein
MRVEGLGGSGKWEQSNQRQKWGQSPRIGRSYGLVPSRVPM